MIVYSATREEFVSDVEDNRIHERIGHEFERRLRRRAPEREVAAWRNSMQFMAGVLRHSEVPADAGVSIEFVVPMTAKRVDFILTGRDSQQRETAVIVELKQWSDVSTTTRDAIVETHLGGSLVECVHPSYQAWTYAQLIEDYNATVQDERIRLEPCAYLHNLDREDAIRDARYDEHLARAPVFLSSDTRRLAAFLDRFVKTGDRDHLMYRIEHGRIRPSKGLTDALASMLEGNREFLMIDDQKQVYETSIDLAYRAQNGKRQVLLVQGGPGTGKSVVAVNLLVELTRRGMLTQYTSRNAAPRDVYAALLSGTMKRTRIQSLFKGSGSYVDVEPRTFGALIVDEAHRLTEKSGLYGNLGDHQVAEIIRAAAFSVFFLDEDQRVTLADIGTRENILTHARAAKADVHELELRSQFRCAGSDGYLAFVDSLLQIRQTANPTIASDEYDFRVFNDPCEMRSAITDLDGGATSARMVAGYCWDWKSKKDRSKLDIVISGTEFAAQWNLALNSTLWMISEGSIKQVGCIHTCQGLEVDYIGVIVGPDFVVRDGIVETDALQRSRGDKSVRGIRSWLKRDPRAAQAAAARIIQNTYRTLMTRGRRGCFVYCTDPETAAWFRSHIDTQPRHSREGERVPVQIPDAVQTLPYSFAVRRNDLGSDRAVPVIDLAIAAGGFGSERWPDPLGWASIPANLPASDDHFLARVHGNSMNKRIPDGAWCLFRLRPSGTLDGRILVVAHRAIKDADTSAQYTLKRYRRTVRTNQNGVREATNVTLEPETWSDGYEAIRLGAEDADDVAVIAEFVCVAS